MSCAACTNAKQSSSKEELKSRFTLNDVECDPSCARRSRCKTFCDSWKNRGERSADRYLDGALLDLA